MLDPAYFLGVPCLIKGCSSFATGTLCIRNGVQMSSCQQLQAMGIKYLKQLTESQQHFTIL
uniref:Uncharacterized protein n=1 Tax=Arundo donax TaxID=35708 RepID=A0A0A8Z4F1_ARUDO